MGFVCSVAPPGCARRRRLQHCRCDAVQHLQRTSEQRQPTTTPQRAVQVAGARPGQRAVRRQNTTIGSLYYRKTLSRLIQGFSVIIPRQFSLIWIISIWKKLRDERQTTLVYNFISIGPRRWPS